MITCMQGDCKGIERVTDVNLLKRLRELTLDADVSFPRDKIVFKENNSPVVLPA